MFSTTTKADVISVSQLNKKAKQLLQIQMGMLWVKGEISSFSRPASGHWYFTLKDEKAQIRCAMFKGRNQLLKHLPKQGDEVIVRGQISLYEARGDYQLIAEHLEPEGEGRLRQAFEALKAQLQTEGLFSQEHKQALPEFPRHIAVISSSTGAAVHDICSTLKRRWPICKISIFPSLVQGEQAATQISKNIVLANSRANLTDHPIEAIIVGRGGGSIEDLQAFNEESVARAIFNSALPIISAVGHETDFSISDFVADSRAATPTAAAELISPEQFELEQHLDVLENKLTRIVKQQISHHGEQLRGLKRGLQHPLEKIKHYQLQFNTSFKNLTLHQQLFLDNLKQQIYTQSIALKHYTPLDIIHNKKEELQHSMHNLHNAVTTRMAEKKHLFESQVLLLNAYSPLSTLSRGYSIVSNEKNEIITSSKQTKKADTVHIKLSDGHIKASILSTDKK